MGKILGKIKNKKGISPIVATVILIGFVVLIILLIWLWSRNIYVEQANKETALAQEKVKCNQVQIEIERIVGTFEVRNVGGIILKGFEVREDLGTFIRASLVYVDLGIGESFPLTQSNQDCSQEGTGPSTPGALCGNSKTVDVIPALQPEGRGAPLVPCERGHILVNV